MAKQCFMFSFNNCGNFKGTSFFCAESISSIPGSCGIVLIIDGVNTGIGEKSAFWSVVTNANPAQCPAEYPFYSGTCTECLGTPHDCLNGICVPATQYNTAGVFPSLTDCQVICTQNGCQPIPPNYCPPGKVCLEAAEWSQVEQYTGQVKAKFCG